MEKNCGRGIWLTRGPVGSGLLLRLVELGLVDAVHLRRLVAHGSVRAGKNTGLDFRCCKNAKFRHTLRLKML